MSLRALLFLVTVTSLLLLLAGYVARRALAVLGAETEGKRARNRQWTFTGSIFAAMLLPWLMRFHATMHDPVSETLAAFGYLVGLGVIFSAVLLFAVDVVRTLFRRLARGGPERERAPVEPPPPTSSTEASEPAAVAEPTKRREFLTRAVYASAIAVGGGHSGYAMFVGRHDYVIEELTVRIRDLPAAFEGLTIAQISDVHIGTFVREPELDAAVDRLRRMRADLVAMTGDLIDHDPARAELLGRFARRVVELGPRFGVHGIAGNHDYYTGVDVVLDTLRGAGVNVLRNQAGSVVDGGARLALLGVDDVWGERDNWGTRYDLDLAIGQAPRDCPRILLCHNPERFVSAAPHVDLQLSGHTHGGQVNLGVRPADIFLRHGFVAGHYAVGTGQLYVNRGFGTVGPPARLHAPPELTRFTLVRA